jgi:4,5-dihydroxyphthalate decarboxylase
MAKRLTIALERYDRHIPFFMQQLNVPPAYELVPLEVGMAPLRRHGEDRHGRMLKGNEFDIAEVSLASYIIGKSRGAPFIAVPVFPRRLFSANHIFVAQGSRLRSPADLAGKRVVIWAFQVTMSVLAKGDFKRDYGVGWQDIQWFTLHSEELDVPGLPVTRLPSGTDPLKLLHNGEVDAFIHPHPPEEALSGHHGIRHLFDDPADECRRYFKRHGYDPIMHLIAIKEDLAKNDPELPGLIIRLWDEAKVITDEFYRDPGYAMAAFAQLAYHRQKSELATDIWVSGLKANRANLEHFVDDMVDQKLIDKPVPMDRLFHPSTLGT